MPDSEVPEGLVKFAHALVGTPHLRVWFYSLEHLSGPLREAALAEMAAQMQKAGEDHDLTAVETLAKRGMYKKVLAAVRDRAGEKP